MVFRSADTDIDTAFSDGLRATAKKFNLDTTLNHHVSSASHSPFISTSLTKKALDISEEAGILDRIRPYSYIILSDSDITFNPM